MLDLFLSGGWLMFPILLCSTIAVAIIFERSWSLRKDKIIPPRVLPTVVHHMQNNQVNQKYLKQIASQSPLGAVIARGVGNITEGYEVMMLSMAEEGRHQIHAFERYLNFLGTVAAITPLLGLLGTVTGMIEVFASITINGASNSQALASGISQALLTTAFGLSVAIPALMFHRHFHRKIDEYAVHIEQESVKLAEYVKEMTKRAKQARHSAQHAA